MPLYTANPAIYINTPYFAAKSVSIMRGYYCEVFRTKANESLDECLEKYGTGGQTDTVRGIRTHLIYLDDARRVEYSWLFRVEKLHNRTFIPARLYRDDPNISIKVLENFQNYNGIQLGTVS